MGFEPTRRLNTAYAISSRAPSANSDTSPFGAERVYQILVAEDPARVLRCADTMRGYALRNEPEVRTVWWEPNAVCLIDQSKLPHTRAVVRCESVEAVAAAIRAMVVRGAPAIGVTAAYGVALAALRSAAEDAAGLLDELAEAKKTLDAARPTAGSS